MFKEIEFVIGFSDGRHMAVTAVDEAAARIKARVGVDVVRAPVRGPESHHRPLGSQCLPCRGACRKEPPRSLQVGGPGRFLLLLLFACTVPTERNRRQHRHGTGQTSNRKGL